MHTVFLYKWKGHAGIAGVLVLFLSCIIYFSLMTSLIYGDADDDAGNVNDDGTDDDDDQGE